MSSNINSNPTPNILPQPSKPVPEWTWWPTFRDKWYNWFTGGYPLLQTDLTGRTIIVTGANIGLGLETAKFFYNMREGGPKRLILAVRSVEKGEAAKRLIIDGGQTESKTDVQVWQLDLASFDSVKSFANRVHKELDRLDILVENAGVVAGPFRQTDDGWEHSLQTNVISTFMLATLLTPLLLKTAKLPSPVEGLTVKPHLVIVASEVHVYAQFPQKSQPHIFHALNDSDQYVPADRYRATKLLDVLLTRQLAESVRGMIDHSERTGTSLGGLPIVIDSVTPGFCRSELMRGAPSLRRRILYALFAMTTTEGAKNLVWASLNDDIPPGGYVANCKIGRVEGYAMEPEAFPTQEKLWKELGEIVLPIAPETKAFWTV